MANTQWVKKQDTKLLAITSLYINRFSKFFTSRLDSKFATNFCLNIPPRFKHVATLPCEIWMQKNGIILKYMSYFTIHLSFTLLVKEFLRLVKSPAKSLTMSYTPFALHFCPQRCRSRQISWITCVLQTKTVIKRCYVNRQIDVS